MLWFSQVSSEDNHSLSLGWLLGRRGVLVWHGEYVSSSQRVVQGLLGTLRSFQGICKVTTLYKSTKV